MLNNAFLYSVDLVPRGGVCALVLLVSASLLRDYRSLLAARLGALFAFGTAAYAICSAAGLHAYLGWWGIPIMALAAGNNVVFWIFACALFDEAFRLRWWHAGLWLLVVLLGLADGVLLRPPHDAPTAIVSLGPTLSALGFGTLAVVQTISSWRGDLVEGRRRPRLFIVGASACYIGLTGLSQLLGVFRSAPDLVSVVAAGGLFAIAGAVAWSLLRVDSAQSLFLPLPTGVIVGATPRPGRESHPNPADSRLVAALEQVMTVERTYRQEGLTIGALAERQGMPEYKLRRLINQSLGYRNFSSFLNYYRIAEAKEALADPSQAAVPVLTIALDAGFSSLGPFNRAFKAETGMTPSEYRRLNSGETSIASPDSGIGWPISNSTGPNSKPA
jgi:AraC-like DNA-binding protein